MLIIRWIRNRMKKKKETASNVEEHKANELSLEESQTIQEPTEQTIQEKSNSENAETIMDSPGKKEADWDAWKPPVKELPTVAEANEIASVRGEKKRVDIPSIRDEKKTVVQDSKALEAEVQWKEELEKALAQEVNKTIDERKEENNSNE